MLGAPIPTTVSPLTSPMECDPGSVLRPNYASYTAHRTHRRSGRVGGMRRNRPFTASDGLQFVCALTAGSRSSKMRFTLVARFVAFCHLRSYPSKISPDQHSFVHITCAASDVATGLSPNWRAMPGAPDLPQRVR